MNRFRWVVAVMAALVLAVGTLAFAQAPGDGGRRGPGGPGGPGGRGFGGPAGIELRGLDLTDAQRDQIRDIVQRYQEQIRADVMLVLTPEQQAKAKELQAQRQARVQQRQQRLQQRRQNQNQQNN
jgi:Spy/CpxP family protein refolding chaperone